MKNTFCNSQKYNDSFNNDSINSSSNVINFNNSKISSYSKVNDSQLNKVKKLIGENDDLDSEFLYKNNGIKFSKNENEFSWNKNVFKNDKIPGPDHYNPSNSLKKLDLTKGSTKFSKKKKLYYLEEQYKNDTPGPIYNPKKNMISN